MVLVGHILFLASLIAILPVARWKRTPRGNLIEGVELLLEGAVVLLGVLLTWRLILKNMDEPSRDLLCTLLMVVGLAAMKGVPEVLARYFPAVEAKRY